MRSDEISTSRVAKYSNNHLALLNYNKKLRPEIEKQRNFKTIPNIPPLAEFQSQLHIPDRASEEKASTVSKIVNGIKSILPVLSLIRLLVFLFHQ